MANHKSAKKRIRQTEKRRLQNRYFAKTMRNAIRSFRDLTDKKEAQAKLGSVISIVDRVAKRNQIHNNKASNIKSKLMKHVNAI